jgi:Flp pilus assembly protein TadG
MKRHNQHRRGAVIAETAIVLALFVFLLIGLVIGGMTVMHYQMVTAQAQEASRYASVHGLGYQRDTFKDSPTAAQIKQQVVTPLATSMNHQQLAVKVEWINKATNIASDWDVATKAVKSINSAGEYVTNHVRVTVTYQWNPGFFGAKTFTGVSERPMAH